MPTQLSSDIPRDNIQRVQKNKNSMASESSEPGSPQGTRHMRLPRESADNKTRLNCVLLNYLQRPLERVVHTPDPENTEYGDWLLRDKFNRNSRQLRLRHNTNITDVFVGVKYNRIPQDGYTSYFLAAVAIPSYIDPNGERIEGDAAARLTLQWNIDPADLGKNKADEYNEWCDSLGWERMLDLLERFAKVEYNQYGEKRSPTDAGVVDSRLQEPVLPELPGITFGWIPPLTDLSALKPFPLFYRLHFQVCANSTASIVGACISCLREFEVRGSIEYATKESHASMEDTF